MEPASDTGTLATSRPAEKPMRLLALGLGRSSTDSLRKALLILGFDGVYHGWIPPLESLQDYDVWQELAASQWNYTGKPPEPIDRQAFARVLGDYEATTVSRVNAVESGTRRSSSDGRTCQEPLSLTS